MRGVDLVAGVGIRPYQVDEIVDSLRMWNGREVPASARPLLDLLRREFAAESAVRYTPGTRVWAGALWVEPQWENLPGDRSVAKGVVRGEFAAARGERFSAYLRAEVDSDGEADPDFQGRTWKRNLTGMVEYATLQWRGEDWRITAGRRRPAWGPAPEGGLLLSGRSPSLDGAAGTLRWGPFTFQALAVQLDAIEVRRSELADSTWAQLFSPDDRPRPVSRFLSGHRVVWRPSRRLALGASEVVLYGGPERTWDLAYLIPLLPLYNEQWNRGGNDNILVGLDAEWFPARGHRLWGELLVDDAQYDAGNEPQEIGGSAGWQGVFRRLPGAPLLEAAYTRVNPYVYGHAVPWNRYTMGGTSLGDPLTDGDRVRIGAALTREGGDRWLLEASWSRRGEVTPETPRPRKVAFPGAFPAGVVERTYSVRVGFERILPARGRLVLWLGRERVENRKHVTGATEDRVLGGVELRLGVRHLAR